MEQKLENNDWKTDAPVLASLSATNPFVVPEGYFEGLGNEISGAIALEGLKSKVDESGFTTPKGYFEELNEKINSGIYAEKLKAAVSEDGFTTPANYFEQMQANILTKTITEPTEVKSRHRILRLWQSKVVKYASAACFVIVAGLGTLYLNDQSSEAKLLTADTMTEQLLYDIDEDVIIQYIETNGTKEPETSNLDAAMENYILNNYSQEEIAGL